MKKHALLKTNLLICCIIMIGFIVTSVVSYTSNIDVFKKEAEHISALASDGIYSQIDAILAKPVTVSLTMANDYLLKEFIEDESQSTSDPAYEKQMRQYLDAYKKKYNYDSVFLISTATQKYYHFSGLNRTLGPHNRENIWYYAFLSSDEDYSLNVDNDEATDNSITVFINCKIKNADNAIIGVVGVGFRVKSLQAIFQEYDDTFNVQAFLINSGGTIDVSPEIKEYSAAGFFRSSMFTAHKERILTNQQEKQEFWYADENQNGYIITRYIANLNRYLVVFNNTTSIKQSFDMQIVRGIVIVSIVIILVLITITYVIRTYNARIIQLTITQEFEHQRLLRQTTEELYDNIYEFDVTRDKAGSPSANAFFTRVGMEPTGSYMAALSATACGHVQSSYQHGYLATFAPDAVIAAYKQGVRDLRYEFMGTREAGKDFRWIRVNAQIFFWNSDKSLRMIMYCKDIHAEKSQVLWLMDASQRDPLTGLYNKIAIENVIAQTLQASTPTEQHAFIIFDIDSFKRINDTGGHALGDTVITEFALELKNHFRNNDSIGRIGGDEFCILVKNYASLPALRAKLNNFCALCARKVWAEMPDLKVLTSIGVALFPLHGTSYAELYEKSDKALYQAKSTGKNKASVFDENTPARSPIV